MNYTLLAYIPKDGIRRPGAALRTKLIGGVTHPLFACSAVQMADRVAPLRWQAGIQGSVISNMYGIGSAVLAVFGG